MASLSRTLAVAAGDGNARESCLLPPAVRGTRPVCANATHDRIRRRKNIPFPQFFQGFCFTWGEGEVSVMTWKGRREYIVQKDSRA